MRRLLFLLIFLSFAGAAFSAEERIKSFDLRVVPERIYAGQVFRFEATVEFAGSAAPEFVHILGLPDRDRGGVFTDQWRLVGQERDTDGETRERITKVVLSATAFATNAVNISFRPQVTANMVHSMGFFSRSFTLRKPGAVMELDILPLPEPVPADFSGAVGEFRLSGAVEPSNVVTGEVVCVRLKLSGSGRVEEVGLPGFAAPDEKRFKVYSQHEKARGGGIIETEQIWIPLSTNAVSIPGASYVCFNPVSGEYETLRTGPFPLTFRTESASTNAAVKQVIMERTGTADKTREARQVINSGIRVLAGERLLKLSAPTQVYFAPSAKSLVLQMIPAGAEVILTERSGEWSRVIYLNRSGWIRRAAQ